MSVKIPRCTAKRSGEENCKCPKHVRSPLGRNCSATCPTKNHMTFGECMRAKALKLSPRISDSYGTKQKAWDKELDSYESAVRQGVHPEGTTQAKIDKAMRKAEASA